MNVFDILNERGFIEQVTHEDEVKELLSKGPVTFYIGFDPTADSLHVGHFIQIMVMTHMQRAGHIPVALIGDGTAMVGDPSGKTDMRKMMTTETIDHNMSKMKSQIEKYIVIDGKKGHFVNNGQWLRNLNYIEFLREVGSKFSVNRMLQAECFKQRMEKGLTFLEFNYMVMQGYDFLELNRRYGCNMQLGGNDQWSNILAGTELIRRSDEKDAYGLTFKLLVTSQGHKMGKTESGALWIDPLKTSPYEFFQYFRNVEDPDVINCIKLLTFVPMERIHEMEEWSGARLNEAKEILAYEVTKIVHGEKLADEALSAAKALFSGDGDDSSMPATHIDSDEIADGINVIDLVIKSGLAASRGEVRRLIDQKGLYINNVTVISTSLMITTDDFNDASLKIRKGKKVFHKVIVK